MTEWNIVLVLAELIGLFVLVGKPILTLNKTIAEFNTKLENMGKRVDTLECDKHEAHKELWQHNDTQDEKIADHETRIRVLEREV
jgi:hypothetical protein